MMVTIPVASLVTVASAVLVLSFVRTDTHTRMNALFRDSRRCE